MHLLPHSTRKPLPCLATLNAEAEGVLPSAEVPPSAVSPRVWQRGKVLNFSQSVCVCPGQGDLLPS